MGEGGRGPRIAKMSHEVKTQKFGALKRPTCREVQNRTCHSTPKTWLNSNKKFDEGVMRVACVCVGAGFRVWVAVDFWVGPRTAFPLTTFPEPPTISLCLEAVAPPNPRLGSVGPLVKPRRPSGPQAFQEHHQKIQREDTREARMVRNFGGKTKRENWGPSPFGPPTRGATVLGHTIGPR